MNWNQFLGLIRLRYLLSKNQIAKGGMVNATIYAVAFFFLIVFAVTSFVGTLIGGAFYLADQDPSNIIFIWNAVTLVFVGASLFEFVNRIQQNDVIEVERLLHLPMTFSGAFLLNYVSTWFTLNILSFAPCMLGLAIAMPLAKGPATIVAIPLTLTFLFMVTSMFYLARGWFAELVKNKRTKGWLMIGLPFCVGGLAIGVSKALKSFPTGDLMSELPCGFLTLGVDRANRFGSWLPGILGTVCMLVIGSGCLFFAYRKSLKKYTGENVVGRTKTDHATGLGWKQSRQFNTLPGTSAQSSAVAMATMKSLRRAPECLAAVIPAIAAVLLGSPYLIGMKGYEIPIAMRDWLPFGVIFVTMIGFPAFLFSTYSYDRDGFRAFVLSPLPRAEILHGKNLGIGIPTVITGWITLLILQIFVPQKMFWFVGTLIQIPAAYLFLCLIGHLISIFFPIGFKRGSMTPVNVKALPAIVLYAGIIVGPAIATIPAKITHGISVVFESYFAMPMGWLYVVLSLIQLVASWVIYRNCLSPLATLLWNHEPEILQAVANIPE
ncbi:MAG: hypothetical protein AB8B55_01550 [Mariniblastus sp.]